MTASVAIAFALGGCATAPPSDADPAPSRRAAAPVGPSGPAWISLFNGRDLTGWTPKITGEALGADARETFRVEDGALVVSYDGYETFGGAFGHLFCNVPYTDYDLRLEYRFTGTQCPGGPGWAYRNSGVMIHGQPPRTMRVDQEFPVSIEVQLLGGDGSTPRATGNLCTPGTHIEIDGALVTQHCTNSTSATYHGDDWVRLEIEVRGGRSIVHRINGTEVLRYGAPHLDIGDDDARAWLERRGGDPRLEFGSVSLQAESHPCAFRAIEVRPISLATE